MLLIESIVLVTDRGPGRTPKEQTVATPQVTVFVGPNNSGKSLALREVLGFLDRPNSESQPNIIKRVAVRPFGSQEELIGALGEVPYRRQGTLSRYRSSNDRDCQVTDDDLAKFGNSEFVFYLAGRIFVGSLDGATRLALVNAADGVDLQGLPDSPLAALFVHTELRHKLREAVFAATGKYLVIDPTSLGKLRFRLSSRPPEDEAEEQGLATRSRNFHTLALEVAEQGDGTKAYVGLLAAVLATGHRVLLIDEPEAFLHPPWARSVAAFLCSFARERHRQLFLATHSEHVVMGCVDSGADVQIVRLEYKRAEMVASSSARVLPPASVAVLMRDPLLRSAGAMAALFAPGAVVVEGASDRAFYKEVDHRLAQDGSGGTKGAVFLEAQNCQTIGRFVIPLRSLGVRAAAIVDLDVVLRPGAQFDNLLQLAGIPKADWPAVRKCRDALEKVLEKAHGEDYLSKAKELGIRALPTAEQGPCRELIDFFAARGVFVVDVGELEGWLPHIGAGLAKKEWVPRVFERMGSEGDPKYVKPDAGDVWAFIRRVGEWLNL